MFADELRRAIEAAPRITLPQVSALVWRAYGAGQVSEAEADALSNLIEARKLMAAGRRSPQDAQPVGQGTKGALQPQAPSPRHSVGSRPRTDASMERRRRWVASGRLPPQLAARFTMGEAAVLAVVAAETVRRKDCRLAVGHIAAIAGVSETTVRNAVRQAVRHGLITVEERRITGWRNDTNVLHIVAPEWTAWLRLAKARREGSIPLWPGERSTGAAAQGGGCKIAKGTSTSCSSPGDSVDRNRRRAAERHGRRPAGATSG